MQAHLSSPSWRRLALPLHVTQHYSVGQVAVSVERLNCSVFCLSFLAGGGPLVRSSSDSHFSLLMLSVMSYIVSTACVCMSTIYISTITSLFYGIWLEGPCPLPISTPMSGVTSGELSKPLVCSE